MGGVINCIDCNVCSTLSDEGVVMIISAKLDLDEVSCLVENEKRERETLVVCIAMIVVAGHFTGRITKITAFSHHRHRIPLWFIHVISFFGHDGMNVAWTATATYGKRECLARDQRMIPSTDLGVIIWCQLGSAYANWMTSSCSVCVLSASLRLLTMCASIAVYLLIANELCQLLTVI